jgi:hypothetical protein
LPPGVTRRDFGPRRRPVRRAEGAPAAPGAGKGEGPPGPLEFPFAAPREEPPRKKPVETSKAKRQAGGFAGPAVPQQATFAWD